MRPSHSSSSAAIPSAARQLGTGTVLRMVLPYLWPRDASALRWRLLGAILCLALSKGANLTVPVFFKWLVDGLAGGVVTTTAGVIASLPIGLLAGYGLARIGSQAFAELRDALFSRVAQRAVRRMALQAFRHVFGLSLRFHLDRQTGGLSRTVERGAKGIEFLLFFLSFNVIPTLIEVLLVCGVLWYLYGAIFAAVTFVTIGLYVWYTLTVTEWRIRYRRRMNEKDTEASARAVDSMLNYETVKYFGNEDHEAHRYDRALLDYEEAAVKSRVTLSVLNIGQNGVIAIGATLLMGMAASRVLHGTMSVGDFVLVNTYLIQLYLPLNFLGTAYREIRQALIDMDAMLTLIRQDAEIKDNPDARALRQGPGLIRFEHVSFDYDVRRPILSDVSFTVPAGGTVAIVGPSGAGKSTIARLLFRFYDVSGGRITIDGQDIRDVTQASLRAAIGVVPQDTVLFNDTIYDNIAYGRPSATPAEIEQAARLAHLHEFIQALPDGYRTKVGERGLKLSGGEKQRVAIARTILKNPPILLFDEATSALDTKTEKEIQRSLDEMSQNRTTLMIAHRLSTVIHADEIIVLERGRVAERGHHHDLLAQNGIYAALWRQQQEAVRRGTMMPATEGNASEAIEAQR